MRNLLLFLMLLSAYSAKSQFGNEDFYPERELKLNLQNAKTPGEQIYAAGFLAIKYKKMFKDSLAAAYIKDAYDIATVSADNHLMADALWWDAYCSANAFTRDEYNLAAYKANNLTTYAKRHKLILHNIAANLILVDINIHHNLALSEKYGLTAKADFESWKADTTGKDSIRLILYGRLSHVYIHKKDGVSVARYMVALQDYVEQDKNEVLKFQAISVLAEMYLEWDHHQMQATPLMLQLYDYYRKTKRATLEYGLSLELAMQYAQLGDKELATAYIRRFEKMQDSLGSNGQQFWWITRTKRSLGLTRIQDQIHQMDSHFDGHLDFPISWMASLKADLYLESGRLDSAWTYLALAKKSGVDSMPIYFTNYQTSLSNYYLQKKEYSKAIVGFNEVIKRSQRTGNLNAVVVALRNLIFAYVGTNDYESAYSYQRQYHHLKDSLDDLNNQQDIAIMQMQKQKDLQDAKFKEQSQQQELAASRVAYRNRVRLYILLAIAVVIFVIAGILLKNNRQRKKANLLLLKQKEEIQNTLQALKATQSQLIQSEKMASLGELTAGIAHEIQNPLNFVNNFSEVNKELLAEMDQEIEKGNLTEIRAIAKDIVSNEEKINHHGKRADAIVKGMLQHSKTTSGQKEPTDINALADEYVRLAYHGLRAKDKSFNANFETHFDNTIGKVNIVPQDIGRVLLNLINNAFYSVAEKKKSELNGYEPIVSITTKKLNGRVEIRVRDNGMGIPQKLVDKIFQPFFTTKPTGTGTGLGLSLSHDIITKGHGGELRVETKEGEFAEFVVLI